MLVRPSTKASDEQGVLFALCIAEERGPNPSVHLFVVSTCQIEGGLLVSCESAIAADLLRFFIPWRRSASLWICKGLHSASTGT